MEYKNIKKITNENHFNMVGDGFRVFQYIPGSNRFVSETSPFIMLDYNAPFDFPPSQHRKGVGEHPHKGFETVTIAFDGFIEHRDSSGGGGVIGPGDVQWMTAGSGILHDEFQTDEMSRKGGTQHMIQLWVNLPAKDKSAKPGYQSITDAGMGKYAIDDKGSLARVIAGNFKGVQGPAKTFTPIQMYDIILNEGSGVNFEIATSHNTMLLVTKGQVLLNDKTEAGFKDFVLFGHTGETIKLKATADTRVFVISGEPINEPIARYGPFVMNTQEELIQAFEDFNAGKFGKI